MSAGRMDRRITIERATFTTNEFGEGIQSWAPFAVVWAGKKDLTDKERLQSAEISAEITTRFRIRWSPSVASVNPKDRLVFDGRVFEIWGVKEVGRKEALEISATAKADL